MGSRTGSEVQSGAGESDLLKASNILCEWRSEYQTQARVLKSYVWSVLLYGVEAWTLKMTTVNKMEAFEMWTLRRMLRIPWIDRVKNEEVIRRAGLEDRELFRHMREKKIAYLGHILRGERYHFQRLILQGKIEGGKRGLGRKKLSWLRNIRQWTGTENFQDLQTAAVERII